MWAIFLIPGERWRVFDVALFQMSNLKLLFPFFRFCLLNTRETLSNIYNLTLDMQSRNILDKKYKLPKGIPTIDLLELFPGFEETISDYTFLEGTSTINDIAILKLFAKRFPTGKYFEFGTWRGESISNVAACMKECVSLSFSEKEMRDFKLPDEVINVSRIFSRHLNNVKQIEHNTLTYDFKDLKGKFDLVFVDADHKYEAVKTDTRNAFSLLRDENSIIVFHDAGKDLEDINWPVQAGILDGAPNDDCRAKIYKISNSLCAVYINGKYNTSYPERYKPNKKFTVKVFAEKL